jgi:cyclopropane-fatty-acyl-phospholipid synthase
MSPLAVRGANRVFADLLARADVRLDGVRPWDLVVRDSRVAARVLAHGSLGLGDSYVDGWWDCEQLDEMIHRVLRADLERHVRGDLRTALAVAKARLVDRFTAGDAREVSAHYGVGNDFFRALLGPTMAYTCAYWRRAETLDDAQRAKHDLIADKLGVREGQRVLDLGCGWGGFARQLAASRGAHVVGVNISPEQVAWANAQPPPTRGWVDFLRSDYRAPQVARLGRFDHVVSIGMIEHVGRRNYRALFELVRRLVRDEGLVLFHTIGTNISTDATDAWIERRIFPGSVLASVTDLARAAEGLFVIEDWHNFAADYDRTLLAWAENLERHAREVDLDSRLHRTFRYYLRAFAGCFRARRTIQLWQLVLSPQGVRGGYTSIR